MMHSAPIVKLAGARAEIREIARGSGVFVKGKVKLTPEIGYK